MFLGIFSICLSVLGLAVMIIKWCSTRKNGALIVEKFYFKHSDFFQSFLRLYPYMKDEYKLNFPKFLIFYLCNKKYIKVHVKADGSIVLLRDEYPTEKSEAEYFLLNSLFQEPDVVFTSDGNVMGTDAVSLDSARMILKKEIPNIPTGFQVNSVLRKLGKEHEYDKEHRVSDKKWELFATVGMIIVAYVPFMHEDTFGFTSVILIFICYVWAYVAMNVPLLMKRVYADKEKHSKVVRSILTSVVVLFAYVSCMICFCFILYGSCMIADGITLWAMLISFASSWTMWIGSANRKFEEEKYYSVSGNDLNEFINVIRKTSRKLKKNTASDKKAEYLNEDEVGLLPFTMLFNGKKFEKNIKKSKEEMYELPSWCETEEPMTFESIYEMINKFL